jgi:hypothetical protein
MGKVGRCQTGDLVHLKKYPVGCGRFWEVCNGSLQKGATRTTQEEGASQILDVLWADFGWRWLERRVEKIK